MIGDDAGAERLERVTVLGLKWASGAEVIRFTVLFAVSVVLARLLRPEEFGQVAMVLVFTACAGLLGDMGFSLALIQSQDIDERALATVFWFQLLAGAVLAVCLAMSAPAIAAFYGTPQVEVLARVASLQFLVYPMSAVHKAQLTRTMSFPRLMVAEGVGTAVGAAVGIGGALLGWGAISLVFRTLAGELATAGAIWGLHPWFPRCGPSLRALTGLWPFARSLVAFRLSVFVHARSDDLLIGRFLGSASLGIYDRAFVVVNMVLALVRSVAGRVMLPALARIQGDRPRAKRAYLRSIHLLMLVCAPVFAGLAAVAEPLVRLLYGEAWVGVAPVLRVYCAIGVLQAVSTTTGWIYVSQGRSDLMFRWGVLVAAVVVPCFGLGVWAGTPVYVALCHLMAILALIYPGVWLPGALIGLSVGDVAKALAVPTTCAVAMLVVVAGTEALVLRDRPLATTVGILVAEGAAVYAAFAYMWMRASVREALRLLRG